MPVGSSLRLAQYARLQTSRRRQYKAESGSNTDNATNEADHAEPSGESDGQSEGQERTSAASG